jgi:polyisoprenoid-binding protein YceI
MRNTQRFLVLTLGGLVGLSASSYGETSSARPAAAASKVPYTIDAKKSRFIVETQTGGLSANFAHDHRISIDDFSGQATFAPQGGGAASLLVTVRAGSLHLLGEESLGARQAIESALREDVLETAKFPEISFKSRSVKSSRRGDGTYDVRLVGELSLHGVKKQVTVPARVSLEAGTLHAIGTLELRQTDFGITPFSFVNGTVTIRDTVILSFDIIATQK